MADWACVLCGAPPKDGSLALMLVTNYAEGVCSNLGCKTRKLKKIKLRSGVRGAEYSDTTGKATFRRTHE